MPDSLLFEYVPQVILYKYCKFGNFREDFIFAKLAKFLENKTLAKRQITLSFIDIGKSCLSCEFFTSLICLLMLFATYEFLQKISEPTVAERL